MSGAFGGILAYGLVRINYRRPGWTWIFLVEGAFTVLFGLLSFFILPRSPQAASFFTPEEKEYVMAKLREDGSAAQSESDDKFSWSEVWKAFCLPHVMILGVALFLDGTSVLSPSLTS
jgi:sugar phosphate permease